MGTKGWLSRDDFDALDDLLGKLGYGGYYDFLECLKWIGCCIGAFRVPGGHIDHADLKTITDVETLLSNWAGAISRYMALNPDWEDEILALSERVGYKPEGGE